MLRQSRFWRTFEADVGYGKTTSTPLQTGSRKVSALVMDYISECTNTHNVQFHAPLLFGLRSTGMRGVFLAEGHKVARNQPIVTIPYKSLITKERMISMPAASPVVSEEEIYPFLIDQELRALVPTILLAIQVCHRITLLPRSGPESTAHLGESPTEAELVAEQKRLEELFTAGIMPWCRMLDDEDWSEEQVVQMYKPSLDSFQIKSYQDLALSFSRTLASIHSGLNLPFHPDLFRRMTRIILARMDQVPTEGDLRAGKLKRLFLSQYRSWTQTPVPRISCVVPFLDMLNHSNRPNVGARFHIVQGEPVVTIFSLCHLAAGHELCRHYNFSMDRTSALFRYGFLPFETFAIPDLDPWQEHYAGDRGVAKTLRDESEDELRKKKEVSEEVARLQAVFNKRAK